MDASIETLIHVSLITPMGDPNDPDCVWGAPVIFWGSPGIGKSDRVRQASAAAGLGVAELFLSTCQPEDLSGIPMQNKEGEPFTHFMHPGVNRLIKAKRGVIFIDELTCARPAVQGAGLSLVRDRILANDYLPGGIRIVAAANPPEEAAGGWELSLPMANRLIHFDMPKPSTEEWASWRMSGPTVAGTPALDLEDVIRKRWSNVFPKYQGLFAGFIKHAGADRLLSVPKEGNVARGKAWPSPRTWDMATRIAAVCEALDDDPKNPVFKALQLDFISACVGAAGASEWATWVANADLPNPEVILNNGWTPNRNRLDICFAAYGQAVAWALAHTNKEEQARWAIKAWGLLTDAWKKHSMLDVALAGAVTLARAGCSVKHSEAMKVACKDLLNKLGSSGIANTVNRPGSATP